MKKIILMMFIVISVLGISSCFAKSMTTADFEALVKKCGYEDFGSLSDYTLDSSSTKNFVKYLNNTKGKSIIRCFDEDGHALYTKFYLYYSSGLTDNLMFFYNSSSFEYFLLRTETGYAARYDPYVFEINIENKTINYIQLNGYSPYLMKYNNFSNISLDVFKSDELQRIIMKSVLAYTEVNVLSNARVSLSPFTSYAITTTTYNDTEYKGSISYNAYFNTFKFTFTSGWDLIQDYNFYLERFEIQDDDTLEAKGIHRLTSHNAHAAADKGLYGFNGQHGTDVFPLEESFELDFNGVDISQKYIYRVCIGSITENTDDTVSTTPFISSGLLVFNENTLYTYPYFKFDYSYTEIIKVAYDPDYTDPTEPDNPDDPDDNIADRINNKLDEVKTGIVSGILDGIKNLFIPGDNFFKDYFDELNAWFSDRLGLLYYPIDFLINFFNRFINADYGDATIVIPEIYVPFFESAGPIFEGTTFNFNEFVEQNEKIKWMYNTYLIFADGYLIFLLIGLLRQKLEEVMTK